MILAALIREFKFRMEDGIEIDWVTSVTMYPEVRRKEGGQLPVIVERVARDT